jgi:hypothetical protein
MHFVIGSVVGFNRQEGAGPDMERDAMKADASMA